MFIGCDVVVPFTVIEELDGLKTRPDDVGRAARSALRTIEEHRVRAGGSLAEPIPFGSPADDATFQAIIDTIKTVYDPEIPVDIYELGLIYDISVDAEKRVLIQMTLTSPACPSAQQIPNEVRWKVKAVPGVTDAWVDIVWEPMWTKDRMSEAAKLQLGFF